MRGKAITANRLGDGAVVYLDRHGGWSECVSDCRLAEGEPEWQELDRLGAAAEAERLVVGPYLIEIIVADGAVRPVRLRETIRATGPTVPMGAAAALSGEGVTRVRL